MSIFDFKLKQIGPESRKLLQFRYSFEVSCTILAPDFDFAWPAHRNVEEVPDYSCVETEAKCLPDDLKAGIGECPEKELDPADPLVKIEVSIDRVRTRIAAIQSHIGPDVVSALAAGKHRVRVCRGADD